MLPARAHRRWLQDYQIQNLPVNAVGAAGLEGDDFPIFAVDGAPQIDQVNAKCEGDCSPNLLAKLLVRVANIDNTARLHEVIVISAAQGADINLRPCDDDFCGGPTRRPRRVRAEKRDAVITQAERAPRGGFNLCLDDIRPDEWSGWQVFKPVNGVTSINAASHHGFKRMYLCFLDVFIPARPVIGRGSDSIGYNPREPDFHSADIFKAGAFCRDAHSATRMFRRS